MMVIDKNQKQEMAALNANCLSVTFYRRLLIFFVNMPKYKILIVQKENHRKSVISLVCIDIFS